MSDEEFAQIYRDMELELISSMKRNLSRHLKEEDKVGFNFTQWQSETLKEMKRFQRENKSIIGGYTKGLDKEVQKILQDELKQGSKSEFKRWKRTLGDKFKESDNLRENFFKINDRKIKSLIKSVNNDLDSANTACFRMINDQYRKTIARAVMFSSHGVVSPKKAIDMATKDFLNSGINCIEYKNGRRVNIASYSQMAVRTANTRAQLIGEGQFRQEIGEHLVKITSHGGTCKLCSKWEGKILIDDVYSGGSKKDGKYPLLSMAMEQGLFHPNCRHGLPTYYPELDEVEFDENGPTEKTLKQYQEDLNYINQNIYRFQRLEVGSLDEENIQKYSTEKEKLLKAKELLLKMRELELKKAQLEIKKDLATSIKKGISNKQTATIFDKRNFKSLVDSDIRILSKTQKILPKEYDIVYNNVTGYIATGNSFSINGILRKKGIESLNFKQKETFNTLSNIIDKNKTTQNIFATRRVALNYVRETFDFDLNKALSEENLVTEMKKFIGSEKVEKGFMSCSLTEKSMTDGNVLLNVYIPQGYPAFITENFEESEIILNHDTKYIIRDVNEVIDEYNQATLVIDIELKGK